MNDLADQLADELGRSLAGPAGSLLGLDLAHLIQQRIEETAPALAAQLTSDDEQQAAPVAVDVMHALWGAADPEPGWWRTPLGRACAGLLAGREEGSVTQAEAAAMLGVTRGTVAQLVDRGTLARHPGGGVSRAAVMQRAARLGQRP